VKCRFCNNCRPAVTGLHLPTWLFEGREQKVDAGVDTDKERLGKQNRRPALGAIVMEIAGATVFRLRLSGHPKTGQ
jgi:hypothetical protein